MFYSAERDKWADFSMPYIIQYHNILVRKGTEGIKSLDDVRDRSIICEKGGLVHDYLTGSRNRYRIISVKSQDDAIQLLARGTGDCAIIGEMQAQYFLEKYRIRNVVTSGVPIIPEGYCMAVREGNQELLSILTMGLVNIKKKGEYDLLFQKWFLNNEWKGKHLAFASLAIIAGLLLVLCVLSMWNRLLTRKVTSRTVELKNELSRKEEMERKLKENNDFLRTILDTIPIPVFYKNTKGEYQGFNRSYAEMMGVTREQLINKTLQSIMDNETALFHEDYDRILISSGGTRSYEAVLSGSGTDRDVVITKTTYDGISGTVEGIIGVILDVTEQKRHREEISSSLHEKEILLKEVHHRVKNNLQIVSSLLNLQAFQIRDEATLDLFKSSRNRVYSMALIHEQLYQSGDFSHINIRNYINQLVRNLYYTYSMEFGRISFNVDMDDLFLTVNQAIPCGMVINEIVSNSLKYAFDDSMDKGMVNISMHRDRKALYMDIKDNGKGIPDHVNVDNPQTLGMRLIYNIVTYQLQGNVTVGRDGCGTSFRISFDLEE